MLPGGLFFKYMIISNLMNGMEEIFPLLYPLSLMEQQIVVLAYYWIGRLEDPRAEVERHKEFLKPLDFYSRIYISEDGINGQASASPEAAERYIDWMRGDPRFEGIVFKLHRHFEHPFPKKTVKYRRQLVALDRPVDFSRRGEKISPAEWKKELEAFLEKGSPKDTIWIDVRNAYEWEVGHFEGAELPPLETFREFPKYAEELKKRHDPKKVRVMMCCTGGIRCEFYSALLKEEGFEKVCQLDGGIIGYGLEEGSAHWKGKLFVFDDRMAVPLDPEGKAETIATCRFCQTPFDTIFNCAYTDCNALFIACPQCLKERVGCCSAACVDKGKETGRLRLFSETGKPFRKQRCGCSS